MSEQKDVLDGFEGFDDLFGDLAFADKKEVDALDTDLFAEATGSLETLEKVVEPRMDEFDLFMDTTGSLADESNKLDVVEDTIEASVEDAVTETKIVKETFKETESFKGSGTEAVALKASVSEGGADEELKDQFLSGLRVFDMTKLKVLFSGDIHAYDREIGATRGYADESTRNLRKLLLAYLESDAILHVLGGDIQHGMPEDLKLMSTWRSLLSQMRDAVRERLLASGMLERLKVYDANGELMDIMNDHSCLFSVKGNHDYNRRVDRSESFTFFDDLVRSKIISVPSRIVFGKTEINLYSSKDFDKPLPVYSDEIESVIGVYHDPILPDGQLNDVYMGKKMISPNRYKFFNRVDLAILNDIHYQVAPYKVVTVDDAGVGYETTAITHGSIGRTSYSESHKRDNALLTLVTIEDNGDLEYDLVPMELMPYRELFDHERVVKIKRRENMFQEFSLEIAKVDKVREDPRDEIRKMGLDDAVSTICLELLDEIMGDGSDE